ncbi:MAG: bifunctional DNA primase/polymerase [Microthrixaceae bacterium]
MQHLIPRSTGTDGKTYPSARPEPPPEAADELPTNVGSAPTNQKLRDQDLREAERLAWRSVVGRNFASSATTRERDEVLALLSDRDREVVAELEARVSGSPASDDGGLGLSDKAVVEYLRVGIALGIVRDCKLYGDEYPDFDAYVRDRWNLEPEFADDLIGDVHDMADLALEVVRHAGEGTAGAVGGPRVRLMGGDGRAVGTAHLGATRRAARVAGGGGVMATLPYYDHAHQYLEAGWWPIYVTEEESGIPKGLHRQQRQPGGPLRGRPVEAPAPEGEHRSEAAADAGGDRRRRLRRQARSRHPGEARRRAGRAARHVRRHGARPPSGKYLFKVPPGTRLKGQPGPGIESCQNHHRYVVAWPSLHHTGAVVQWIDTLSREPLDRIPEPDEFPDLPWSWLEGLSSSGSGKVAPDATSDEVETWLERCTENRAPAWLESLVAKAAEEAKANRHDTILKALCDVAREAEVGAYPAQAAVDQLEKIFSKNDHGNADSFESMLSWAVGQLNAEDAEARLKVARDRLDDFTTDWLLNIRDGATVDPDTGEVRELVVPESVDDSSMAEAFAATLQGRYLYVAAWRRWLRWDGRRWAHDDTEAVLEAARQWVIDLGKHLLEENADSKLIGSVAKYRSKARTEAVATMARRIEGIAATPDEFDADPDLLNVANGVIDLRTGALSDHDPALRIRELADVDFDPDATHPDVEAVLEVVTPEVRDWLQQLLGYGITGHPRGRRAGRRRWRIERQVDAARGGWGGPR